MNHFIHSNSKKQEKKPFHQTYQIEQDSQVLQQHIYRKFYLYLKYIQKHNSNCALIYYFSFLNSGKIKEQIKLSKMFVEIQKKNLELALQLQKFVYIINEASKHYNGKADQKLHQKDFLQIKLICSLNRLFEFFYHFEVLRKSLAQEQGYQKVYQSLKLFTFLACEKSKNHLKLYPQMGQVLIQILSFFYTDQKQPFNFHSHLTESTQSKKKTFPQKVKKLFAIIPNKQKSIFVHLSDENFFDYLTKQGFIVPKEVTQNYSRCQEQINAIIAQEENFIESILVPEIYRGKPEWKKRVIEQLVNLSVGKKTSKDSKLIKSKEFKLSDDFPLSQC